MVASFAALGGSASGVAKYFGDKSTANYHIEGGEQPGEWTGRGAVALGLAGKVTRGQLTRVLGGRHPHRNEQLAQIQARSTSTDRKRRDRVPGFDVCFSVPKSVSVLWSASDARTRYEIEAAINSSVRKILTWIESEIRLARRGRDGLHQEFAKLVVAVFRHAVNRNHDPNLHVHCVIANLCQRSDRSWATVNGNAIRDWTRTLGPMFRCSLASELQKRLGVELYQPESNTPGRKQGWFEVRGVPEKLNSQCSSRRAEIDRELGGADASGSSTGQARQRANKLTRKAKERVPPREDLFARWREEAHTHGFDEKAVQKICGRKQTITFDFGKVLKQVLAQITEQQAHFNERDVIRRICEASQVAGVAGDFVAHKVRQELSQSPDIVRLGLSRGEQRFTTLQMWELEKTLLSQIKYLQQRPGAQVRPYIVEKVIKDRTTIQSEQADAVRHLLTQKQSVRILSGVAGAGKSYTLDTVRDGLERAGFIPIGGALAGAAKEELVRQTGINSRTVASYLYHLDKSTWQAVKDRVRHDANQLLRAIQGKNTYLPNKITLTKKHVLILDEAGMLDTRTLQRLVHHVRKAGATLILAGDHKQLPPIAAGGPYKHLIAKLGHAQLQNNQRQRDLNDQQAVQDIREGRAEDALKNYAQRGRVTIGNDKQDTVSRLIATWAANGGVANPKDHVIFTQTRADAQLVNRMCQAERQRFGLNRDTSCVCIGDDKIYVGDRVMFQKAYRLAGIENGYRATVIAVNPISKKISVRLDQEPTGQNRARGLTSTVVVPIRDLGPDGIALGFAATTHKLQGQSVSHSYMLLGGNMTDQEMAYVQATRGRESTRLFVDALHAGPELEDLARSIKKSKAKDLAHDIVERHSLELRQQ